MGDEQLNLPGVYEGCAYPRIPSVRGGISSSEAASIRIPPRRVPMRLLQPSYLYGPGALTASQCRAMLRLAKQTRARNRRDY